MPARHSLRCDVDRRASRPVCNRLNWWTLHRRRYTGGHFDHYVAKYTSWQAGGLDKHVFDKPPNCKPEGVEVMARRPGLDLRTELLALLPPAFHGAARNGVGSGHG